MTHPKYSAEDVQRLVDAAKNVASLNRNTYVPQASRDALDEALAPFQTDPDPDAEVIEAMADAFQNARHDGDDLFFPWVEVPADGQEEIRRWMRAALAAYRAHDVVEEVQG